MRIIAGEWRGRPIEAPPGLATRPTADRVRETLFSMLASRLGSFEDLRVADLFAGSGALGLEALSRGAATAAFVENDPAAAAVIRRNADKLGRGPSPHPRRLGAGAAEVRTVRPYLRRPALRGRFRQRGRRGRRKCGLARAGRVDERRDQPQDDDSSRAT